MGRPFQAKLLISNSSHSYLAGCLVMAEHWTQLTRAVGVRFRPMGLSGQAEESRHPLRGDKITGLGN